MTRPTDESWIEALTFAALPGAVSVELTRDVFVDNGTPTVSYRLRSLDAQGVAIGDERDYDLLKAAMGPLERLSEACEQDNFSVSLDLKSMHLDWT